MTDSCVLFCLSSEWSVACSELVQMHGAGSELYSGRHASVARIFASTNRKYAVTW